MEVGLMRASHFLTSGVTICILTTVDRSKIFEIKIIQHLHLYLVWTQQILREKTADKNRWPVNSWRDHSVHQSCLLNRIHYCVTKSKSTTNNKYILINLITEESSGI